MGPLDLGLPLDRSVLPTYGVVVDMNETGPSDAYFLEKRQDYSFAKLERPWMSVASILRKSIGAQN